jgi:hypothetical protein
MGLFDDLESRCEEIAGKAGIPPETVQSMGQMLQAKLGDGSSQMEAMEAVAREHGVPVDKLQEVLSHCGGAGAMEGMVGGLAGKFFKA